MPATKPCNIVFLYCSFILFNTDNEHVSLNTPSRRMRKKHCSEMVLYCFEHYD